MREIKESISVLDDMAEKLTPSVWPELANVFDERPVPSLPLECLPEDIRKYAIESSAQSGFDAGGYAVCTLIAACNTVDHRARMAIATGYTVPAFSWLGIVGQSGSGKSPIMKASRKFAEKINSELIKESTASIINHKKSNDNNVPPPPWRQRHADDTTVEALCKLINDNPEGVNLFHDEITAFIGGMDAYKTGGQGKDRGAYLQAYDGGSVTINRSSKQYPTHLEQFSVGILAGIQPEVLSGLFKSKGGGSDGLYQRFMVYQIQPSKPVDFEASDGLFTGTNLQNLFNRIDEWNKDKTFIRSVAKLSDEARKAHQAYINNMRILTKRTAANRLAEHLDKFPGFLGRLAFGLHCIECAAAGVYLTEVSIDTFRRAERIMNIFYRHSEAVYEVLDSRSGEVTRLVKSAAEALLSKRWDVFKRGDLTRDATNWKGANDHVAESAIDQLIELGWIADITPQTELGKRGRKSSGVFMANPDCHKHFVAHTERIRRERSERHDSIKSMGAGRVLIN